ncbi:helix-turn-helix transcriptional regulator [Xanthobacter tagetidis]|jgi:AraC-like DNA-binding protein|uniref:AraC family transcriptional regulator n=1 Tax=Xanthobacter tagetidis TaxID=60216 RepID=A0A3L7AN61_9HYPH|nr:AraC family transcriptional regulator [Xanthobacter tagetidis]MBB6307480.1 AraC-like DNA-binding protein [Xanthobacter tagetidis]RLP81061.1 AraC family transcriptional regulator [Xanthobacter tagetidis]
MSRAVAVCHGPFGRVSIYQLDRPLVLHAHREAHLIFYLEGAHGLVTVSGQEVRIDPFMGVAINPWEPHNFHPDRLGCSGLFLVVYLRPEWLRAQTMTPTGGRAFPASALVVTRELAAWRDKAVDMLLSSHRELTLAPVLMALAQASSEPIGPDLVASLLHQSADGALDKRVARACRLLEEHPSYEGVLACVAREAGLSRAHFFKLFREQVGVTPSVFANTVRLDAALERIVRSNDPVKLIGHRIGFSCQSVFTRFFTAHMGMSPSDYRRALRLVAPQMPELRHG